VFKKFPAFRFFTIPDITAQTAVRKRRQGGGLAFVVDIFRITGEIVMMAWFGHGATFMSSESAM